MTRINHSNIYFFLSSFGLVNQDKKAILASAIIIKRNLNHSFLPSYLLFQTKRRNSLRQSLSSTSVFFLRLKDDFPLFYKPNYWREYPIYINEQYLMRSEIRWRDNMFNNYYHFFFLYQNVSLISFKYHWFDIYYYSFIYSFYTYHYFIIFIRFVTFFSFLSTNFLYYYSFSNHFFYLIFILQYWIILFLYILPRFTLYLFLNEYERQSSLKYYEMWPHLEDSFRTYDLDWPHLDLCTHIPIKYDWDVTYTDFLVIQYIYTIFVSYSLYLDLYVLYYFYFYYWNNTLYTKIEFSYFFDFFSDTNFFLGIDISSRYHFFSWCQSPVSETAICSHSFFQLKTLFFLLLKINKKLKYSKKKTFWFNIYFDFFFYLNYIGIEDDSFFFFSHLLFYDLLYFFHISFFSIIL